MKTFKLKLLNALYLGNTIVTNNKMLHGTGLDGRILLLVLVVALVLLLGSWQHAISHRFFIILGPPGVPPETPQKRKKTRNSCTSIGSSIP